MRKLLSLLMLLMAFQAFAIKVTIAKTRLEHNVILNNGTKCLAAHCKLNIDGLQGKDCDLVLRVADDNGNWLTNANGNYVTDNKALKPCCARTEWTDIAVYIANDKLSPKSGRHDYKVYLMVRYNGNLYGKTLAGTYSMEGKKPEANNYHRSTCGLCNGLGYKSCARINFNYYTNQLEPCPTCNGSGQQKCILCDGRGYREYHYPTSNVSNDTRRSSSSSGGSYYYPSNNYSGNSNSNSSSRSSRRQCNACGGNGKGFDEVIYEPNYTGGNKNSYCGKCDRVCPKHTHIEHPCGVCNGHGYL